VLAAAKLAGIDEVYRVGGAQAVAALAYGTETIKPVAKIVGPGNQWVAAAKRRGELPRGSGIGGLIEIHGEGGRGQNWTDGCVALKNADMDDLFARVRNGTRVTIVGGDGSDGAFSSLLARVEQEGS